MKEEKKDKSTEQVFIGGNTQTEKIEIGSATQIGTQHIYHIEQKPLVRKRYTRPPKKYPPAKKTPSLGLEKNQDQQTTHYFRKYRRVGIGVFSLLMIVFFFLRAKIYRYFFIQTKKMGRRDKINENTFILRSDYLNRLTEFFNQGPEWCRDNIQQVTLCGMSGSGKTQLALYYDLYPPYKYTYQFWVSAETEAAMISSFIHIHERLELRDKVDPQEKVRLVKHWLEDNPGWLLIVDGADNNKILDNFIPERGGHVLITSIYKEWQHSIKVENCTDKEALSLFRKISLSKEKEDDILRLVRDRLGGLPLAVAQAAAYIGKSKIMTSDYCNHYDKAKALLLSDSTLPPNNEHVPTAITWDLSFNQVLEKSKKENLFVEIVLNYAAYLHSLIIPRDLIFQALLIDYSNNKTEKLDNDAIKIKLDKSIMLMADYFLMSYDSEHLSMHSLLQTVLQLRNKSNGLKIDKIIDTLNSALYQYGLVQKNNKNYAGQRNLLPHYDQLVRNARKQLDLSQEPQRSIFYRLSYSAADYYRDFFYINQQIKMLEMVKKTSEKYKLPPNLDYANFMHMLAIAYGNRGDRKKQFLMHAEANKIIEKLNLTETKEFSIVKAQYNMYLFTAFGEDTVSKKNEFIAVSNLIFSVLNFYQKDSSYSVILAIGLRFLARSYQILFFSTKNEIVNKLKVCPRILGRGGKPERQCESIFNNEYVSPEFFKAREKQILNEFSWLKGTFYEMVDIIELLSGSHPLLENAKKKLRDALEKIGRTMSKFESSHLKQFEEIIEQFNSAYAIVLDFLWELVYKTSESIKSNHQQFYVYTEALEDIVSYYTEKDINKALEYSEKEIQEKQFYYGEFSLPMLNAYRNHAKIMFLLGNYTAACTDMNNLHAVMKKQAIQSNAFDDAALIAKINEQYPCLIGAAFNQHKPDKSSAANMDNVWRFPVVFLKRAIFFLENFLAYPFHHSRFYTEEANANALPFDEGQWDTEQYLHEDTGELIFVYRLFNKGVEVGTAHFYKHPLLCRSVSGDRHNLIKLTGILTQIETKIDLASASFYEVCDALPPTFSEQLYGDVINAIPLGSVIGLSHVLVYRLEKEHVSPLKITAVNYMFTCGFFFLLSFYQHLQSCKEDFPHGMIEIIFKAMAEVIQIAFIQSILNQAHYQTRERGLTLLNSIIQYGIYSYKFYQKGILRTFLGMAASVTIEKTIEKVGKKTIDNFFKNHMKACIPKVTEKENVFWEEATPQVETAEYKKTKKYLM